jgi:hypothetical protein
MNTVKEVIGKENCIFMGDFNFDYAWENETDSLDREVYEDLWENLKGRDEENFTM